MTNLEKREKDWASKKMVVCGEKDCLNGNGSNLLIVSMYNGDVQ